MLNTEVQGWAGTALLNARLAQRLAGESFKEKIPNAIPQRPCSIHMVKAEVVIIGLCNIPKFIFCFIC